MKIPEWELKLIEDVREASKAFNLNDWPDAWLYLGHDWGHDPDNDWYDSDRKLLDLPVYHCPATLQHSGYDGEHQHIIPLWKGDVSTKQKVIREFQMRLAKSGDF